MNAEPTVQSAVPALATLLDELVPRPDIRTLKVRAVDASPAVVAEAIHETRLGEGRLAGVLLALRTVGRSIARRGGRLDELGDDAPGFVRIGGRDDEVVLGYVGRPWPGAAPLGAPVDVAAFARYRPTDAVKIALSLRCGPAAYGTLLVSETRIVVGPGAEAPFRRYWLLARPASDLVRASLLRAVARRAERQAR